jgi:chaperonin cofactor prefoldin
MSEQTLYRAVTGIEERAKEIFFNFPHDAGITGMLVKEPAISKAIQLATEVTAQLQARIDDLKIEIDWLKAQVELKEKSIQELEARVEELERKPSRKDRAWDDLGNTLQDMGNEESE